jgi:hypothetical protein
VLAFHFTETFPTEVGMRIQLSYGADVLAFHFIETFPTEVGMRIQLSYGAIWVANISYF